MHGFSVFVERVHITPKVTGTGLKLVPVKPAAFGRRPAQEGFTMG